MLRGRQRASKHDPSRDSSDSVEWVKPVRADYRLDNRKRSSPAERPWDENPQIGRTAPLPREQKDPSTLRLLVEWSTARAVREARRELQRELKIPPANGEYVISVRQLPLDVKAGSATLKRVGHDALKNSRAESTTEDKMLVACYFPAVDPITSKERKVSFLFQADGVDFMVLFSIPEMKFQGQLSLL